VRRRSLDGMLMSFFFLFSTHYAAAATNKHIHLSSLVNYESGVERDGYNTKVATAGVQVEIRSVQWGLTLISWWTFGPRLSQGHDWPP
jgi:hypothetical protein